MIDEITSISVYPKKKTRFSELRKNNVFIQISTVSTVDTHGHSDFDCLSQSHARIQMSTERKDTILLHFLLFVSHFLLIALTMKSDHN